MGFLLLAVTALVGLMMTLKLLAVKGISASKAIIINYLIATTIGWLRVAGTGSSVSEVSLPLVGLAVAIGLIFYISLQFDARCSAKAGLALTTIATRAAMVVPIALSALLLDEPMSAKSGVLVLLVVGAMVMIFYEPQQKGSRQSNLLLPFMVFLMSGLSTFSLKLSQHTFGATEAYPFVEPLLFGAALLFATGDTLRKEGSKALRLDRRTIIAGVALGTFNFLTTFFTLQGLRYLPTTTFYPIYYGTAVVVTTILGAALFGEKISPRKLLGIGVALGAIVIISAT